MQNTPNVPAEADSTKLTWQRLWPYAVVILLAFIIRVDVSNHGLPFIENVDEPNMYLIANYWRGKLPADYRVSWLAGYPPGYLLLSETVMNTVDVIWKPNIYTDMALYIRVLRLINVVADTITVGLLMLLVRWLGGDVAAILAGLIYAVSAQLIFEATSALPDTIATLFCAICAVLTIWAIRRDKAWAILAAVVAGLLGVIFKYPVGPVLILPAFGCLVFLRRGGIRAWLLGALSLAAVIATAYGLLFVYGAVNLNNDEAQNARGSIIASFMMGGRWSNIANTVYLMYGVGFLVVVTLAVIFLIIRRPRIPNGTIILTLLVTGALLMLIVPLYIKNKPLLVQRNVWPGTFFLFAVGALAIEAAFFTGSRRWWRWLAVIVPVVWLVPSSTYQFVDGARMNSAVLAQQWFEQNAPDGAEIWVDSFGVYRSLSRFEAGYSGFKSFGGGYTPDMTDWHGKPTDFDYVYLNEDDVAGWPLVKAWPPLDQLTLVKKVSNDGLRGENLYIYSTRSLPKPPQSTFKSDADDLELHGLAVTYDKNTLHVDSFWQAPDHVPTVDYSYFLHLTLVGQPSTILGQQDGQLGVRRTSTWGDQQETLDGAIQPFTIPALPSGNYVVTFGVYSSGNGQRLSLGNGSNELELLKFTVF